MAEDKSEVLQGTLDLMILKTLQALGQISTKRLITSDRGNLRPRLNFSYS